ncbi:MAG: 2Fe-2S iron-sulfur cluster-binding protein, partial [Methylocella sp.]
MSTKTLIKETDFGTPKVKSEKMVTLEIDGRSVTVPETTSVMRAAMELGTEIPKLCATDSLHSFGSCRLCLVEIEGRKGTPASCTTWVQEGMKVRTQTDRLSKLRQGVMELYLSDHPMDGHGEMQDIADGVGLMHVRYGFEGDNHVSPITAEGDKNFR